VLNVLFFDFVIILKVTEKGLTIDKCCLKDDKDDQDNKDDRCAKKDIYSYQRFQKRRALVFSKSHTELRYI
jgi:hypothetical protein